MANYQQPHEGAMVGVETFDTEELAVLVLGEVEPVAAELARIRGAGTHLRDILEEDDPVKISDASYLVLRLAGNGWTIISGCTSSPGGRLQVTDALALSRALGTRAIFFGNSDCASYTEYELFEGGESRERFVCGEGVTFESKVRGVEAPEDGPDVYKFVDGFFREQRAYLPPLSIELNAGECGRGRRWTWRSNWMKWRWRILSGWIMWGRGVGEGV